MLKKTGFEEYKSNQISTAGSEQLVVMLYEGAIKFLGIAIEKNTGPQNYDVVNQNIIKAQDIISELIVSLDEKKNSELASNLMSLYVYFKKKLLEANVKKDNIALKEVLSHLKELKDAWEKVLKNK